jgi:hypothetical protein
MVQRAPRRRWIVPALCAAAVLLGAGGTAAVLLTREAAPTQAAAPVASVASPTASPTPTLEPRSERDTCLIVVPLMVEVLKHVETVKAKNRPDRGRSLQMQAELTDARDRTSGQMRTDLSTVITAVADLRQGFLTDGGSLSGAGVRILETCKKYAKP